MKLGDSLGRRRRRRKSADGSAEAREEAETGATGSDSDLEGSSDDPDAFFRPRESLDKPPRKRGLSVDGPQLVVAVAGIALLGWFIGYLLATQVLFPAPPPPGDLFEIPDLAGLGVTSADERLEGVGLVLGEVDSLQHPTMAAGLILGQSPLAGQLSRPDTPVRVTVSTGPQRRAVPDVLRLDEDRARIVLETSGFVVTVDTAEAEEPRGRVVEVSPPPEEVVALPAQVHLTISTGPPLIAMPLLLGMEQGQAEQMLDSLGLVLTEIEEVFRFGRDQGLVVEQEPAADTELERGSEVRLSVGRQGDGGNIDPGRP